MENGPYLERWKKHFLACLGLVLGAMLVTGAKQVTFELRHRHAHEEQVKGRLHEWSGMLVFELPEAQRDDWQRVAERDALFMIKACTRADERGRE